MPRDTLNDGIPTRLHRRTGALACIGTPASPPSNGCFWHTSRKRGGASRSGAKEHRPGLDRMIEQLREGDTVVVWKLDRLGRSMQNLVELMTMFDRMGVQFQSLTENIDTTTPGGVLIFNMFASLAQFERDLIRERTQAGLQAARARGRVGGRPVKLSDREVAEVRRLYDSRTVTVKQIAELMHCGTTTVYRALRRSGATER